MDLKRGGTLLPPLLFNHKKKKKIKIIRFNIF